MSVIARNSSSSRAFGLVDSRQQSFGLNGEGFVGEHLGLEALIPEPLTGPPPHTFSFLPRRVSKAFWMVCLASVLFQSPNEIRRLKSVFQYHVLCNDGFDRRTNGLRLLHHRTSPTCLNALRRLALSWFCHLVSPFASSPESDPWWKLVKA
jgi:hypothetical protein